MKARLITAAASVPVSVNAFKAQLKIDHDEEDSLIKGYIEAATDYAEQISGNKIISQVWAFDFDEFGELELPHRPLISVDSITYVDTDGVTQTLAASVYTVQVSSFRPKIYLSYDQSWPETRAQKDAVTVTATIGYKQPPARIKQAIQLIVGSWYEHREDDTELSLSMIPHGAFRLLSTDLNRQF